MFSRLRFSLIHLLLSVFVVIAIVACDNAFSENSEITPTSQTSSTPCRMIEHVMGETCIPQEPKRIVTLNITALSNALALGIQPIGSTIPHTFSQATDLYLKDKIQGIELIPVGGHQVNLEEVLRLDPDLIVGPSISASQSVYSQLSQIAPTILLPFQEISYDWKQSFYEIAALFNKTELADQQMSEYYLRVEDLKQKIDDGFCQTFLQQAPAKDCHKQLHVLYAEMSVDGFYVADKYSFPRRILDDFGFQSYDFPSDSMSIEYLPQLKSDVLFIGTVQTNEYGLSGLQELAEIQKMPLWNQLEVVQRGQVHVVNRAIWWAGNILAAHAVLDDIERSLLEAEN